MTVVLLFVSCGNPSPVDQASPRSDHLASLDTTGVDADGIFVSVRLTEYQFVASEDTFDQGRSYVFELVNEGSEAHEWAVIPRGATTEEEILVEVEKEELPAGATHTESFVFSDAGEFDFVCLVDDPVSHDESGMRHPIVVVASEQ